MLFSFVAPHKATTVNSLSYIELGTRCHPGKDHHCSEDKGICLIIAPRKYDGNFLDIPVYNGVAAISVIGNKIHFDFKYINSDDPTDNIFNVNADVPLGTEISAMLNLNNVVLKRGDYPIDYSHNIYGEVDIDFTHD